MDVKPEKEGGCVTARGVLWYLVFTGFAVNYMTRTNLNIAIVSMIKSPPRTKEIVDSECFNATTSVATISHQHNTTENFTEIVKHLETKSSKKFAWDEKKQNLVLGAFFWLHWVTQIPGGILAQKYGTKKVYGLSNFSGALLCFVIPFAAYLGHQYLIFVRLLQGLVTGFAWPAMHNMTAKWIPPNERSRFVTAYLGSSIGSALTYPLCGYIIDVFGWEMAFYVCGVLGTAWYIAWYFLVFDSPQQHPRISQQEKEQIIASLGKTVSKEEKAPIPWKHLLTSGPVWMNIFAQWGGLWGFFTLMTHTPTYFKMVHGWNIRSTGWLSGLPHLMRMLFALAFSHLGDYLLRTEAITRTNVRKFATAVCTIGQGFCMLGLAYSGCNKITAIVFLTMATAANGAVSTGPLASFVDLSPNYASVAFGFCNTTVACIGFITPAVVGYFTLGNQSVGQWQKVFWIATGMLMCSGIVYILFAKSEVQPWNNPAKMRTKKQDPEKPAAELEPLKKIENEEKPQINDENEDKEKAVDCK